MKKSKEGENFFNKEKFSSSNAFSCRRRLRETETVLKCISKCILNPFDNTINILKLFVLYCRGILEGKSAEVTQLMSKEFSQILLDLLELFSIHLNFWEFYESLWSWFQVQKVSVNFKWIYTRSSIELRINHSRVTKPSVSSHETLSSYWNPFTFNRLLLPGTKLPDRTNFKCHYIRVWGVETIKNTSTGTCSTSTEHRLNWFGKLDQLRRNKANFIKWEMCAKIEVRVKVQREVFIRLKLQTKASVANIRTMAASRI